VRQVVLRGFRPNPFGLISRLKDPTEDPRVPITRRFIFNQIPLELGEIPTTDGLRLDPNTIDVKTPLGSAGQSPLLRWKVIKMTFGVMATKEPRKGLKPFDKVLGRGRNTNENPNSKGT